MRILHIRQIDSDRYVLVTGNVGPWLRDSRLTATYSATNRGWHIRRERVADLVAMAEHDGITVRFKGAVA